MGNGCGVRHALVVEKFIALTGHKVAIQAHDTAKAGGFHHLQRLEGGLAALHMAGSKAKGCVRRELLHHPGVLTHAIGGDITAPQLLTHGMLGLQGLHYAFHQCLRLGRVVCREVADIDINRHIASFWPGVNGQVRLCQQDGACHAAWLPLPVRKLHPAFIDQGQARKLRLIAAQCGYRICIQHQL